MRKLTLAILLSALLSGAEALSLLTVTPVFASPLPNVTNNEVILNFP